MAGHVGLGAPGDIREYVLDNPLSLTRGAADNFAAPISTSGAYNDLEGWAETTWEDWSMGLGHDDPEQGPLYSFCDTRVPRQLIPAAKSVQYDLWDKADALERCNNSAGDLWYTYPVGPGTTITKIAIPFKPKTTSPTALHNFQISVYMMAPAGTDAQIFKGSDINTATAVSAKFNLINNSPDRFAFRWHGGRTTLSTNTADTYWIVLDNWTGAAQLALWTESGGAVWKYASGAWSVKADGVDGVVFTTNWYSINATSVSQYHFAICPGATMLAGGNGNLVKSGAYNWIEITGTTRGRVSSIVYAFDKYYIGYADDITYATLNSGMTTLTAHSTEKAYLFTWHKGYLWRATLTNEVYYTSDGTTWEGPFTLLPTSSTINSICGMGDYLYAATSDGLFALVYGDFWIPITRWGSDRSDNGKSMVMHQGALYVIADNLIYRIDPSHTVLPVFGNRDDDLLELTLDTPQALCSTNNWLFALIDQDGVAGEGSYKCGVWAYQPDGWHFVADLPTGKGRAMTYSFMAQHLVCLTTAGVPYQIRIPDTTINPLNDIWCKFAGDSWIEYGRFFGKYPRIYKDWESVYIEAENLYESAGFFRIVDVYYKTETVTTWTHLGTANSAATELRWSNYGTRPSSRWIKIALRLRTDEQGPPPRVRAVSIKYLPMLNDRYRWPLTIVVHDNQEMPDGSKNSQTAAQMVAHLDSLIKRRIPFIYRDIDGYQYEVKIVSHNRGQQEVEFERGTTPRTVMAHIYNLVIEQVTDSVYASP